VVKLTYCVFEERSGGRKFLNVINLLAKVTQRSTKSSKRHK
jgi:hypothetical protein